MTTVHLLILLNILAHVRQTNGGLTLVHESDIHLCNVSYECQNHIMVCSYGSNCSVACTGRESCKNAAINAQYAYHLQLYTGSVSSTFNATYTDSAVINCYDDYSCRAANFYVADVCYFQLLYETWSNYRCQYSSYKFVNVEMVYGNDQLWECLCSSTLSEQVTIKNSTIVINHVVKSKNDITQCTKYASGDITISNYNLNNMQVVNVDTTKQCHTTNINSSTNSNYNTLTNQYHY